MHTPSHHAHVFGASGYSGVALAQLLARHPKVMLDALAAHSHAGKPVASLGIDLRQRTDARFLPMDEALRHLLVARERGDRNHVAFLATPAETSLELGAALAARDIPTVDLSGAHRLDARAREAYPSLSFSANYAPWSYGLPELMRLRARTAGVEAVPPSASSTVANPGCYATAATLSLAPLLPTDLAGGLVRDHGASVVAMSGVTGAGRSAREDLSFAELSEDARAYRVLQHQHTPEVLQALGQTVDGPDAFPLLFVPQLVPLRRGILMTTSVMFHEATDSARLTDHFREAYADEPFIRVLDTPEDVRLRQVVGTNNVHLGVRCLGKHAVIVAALDNLIKGAAGQAIQNANRLMQLPETTGLEHMGGFRP